MTNPSNNFPPNTYWMNNNNFQSTAYSQPVQSNYNQAYGVSYPHNVAYVEPSMHSQPVQPQVPQSYYSATPHTFSPSSVPFHPSSTSSRAWNVQPSSVPFNVSAPVYNPLKTWNTAAPLITPSLPPSSKSLLGPPPGFNSSQSSSSLTTPPSVNNTSSQPLSSLKTSASVFTPSFQSSSSLTAPQSVNNTSSLPLSSLKTSAPAFTPSIQPSSSLSIGAPTFKPSTTTPTTTTTTTQNKQNILKAAKAADWTAVKLLNTNEDLIDPPSDDEVEEKEVASTIIQSSTPLPNIPIEAKKGFQPKPEEFASNPSWDHMFWRETPQVLHQRINHKFVENKELEQKYQDAIDRLQREGRNGNIIGSRQHERFYEESKKISQEVLRFIIEMYSKYKHILDRFKSEDDDDLSSGPTNQGSSKTSTIAEKDKSKDNPYLEYPGFRRIFLYIETGNIPGLNININDIPVRGKADIPIGANSMVIRDVSLPGYDIRKIIEKAGKLYRKKHESKPTPEEIELIKERYRTSLANPKNVLNAVTTTNNPEGRVCREQLDEVIKIMAPNRLYGMFITLTHKNANQPNPIDLTRVIFISKEDIRGFIENKPVQFKIDGNNSIWFEQERSLYSMLFKMLMFEKGEPICDRVIFHSWAAENYSFIYDANYLPSYEIWPINDSFQKEGIDPVYKKVSDFSKTISLFSTSETQPLQDFEPIQHVKWDCKDRDVQYSDLKRNYPEYYLKCDRIIRSFNSSYVDDEKTFKLIKFFVQLGMNPFSDNIHISSVQTLETLLKRIDEKEGKKEKLARLNIYDEYEPLHYNIELESMFDSPHDSYDVSRGLPEKGPDENPIKEEEIKQENESEIKINEEQVPKTNVDYKNKRKHPKRKHPIYQFFNYPEGDKKARKGPFYKLGNYPYEYQDTRQSGFVYWTASANFKGEEFSAKGSSKIEARENAALTILEHIKNHLVHCKSGLIIPPVKGFKALESFFQSHAMHPLKIDNIQRKADGRFYCTLKSGIKRFSVEGIGSTEREAEDDAANKLSKNIQSNLDEFAKVLIKEIRVNYKEKRSQILDDEESSTNKIGILHLIEDAIKLYRNNLGEAFNVNDNEFLEDTVFKIDDEMCLYD